MESFTTSNVSTNSVNRERSIASSFVKQYYTLLNKAPCFIHNFYSHDSTFIHGTIEMANEHHTEPVVGREKIKKKMEDLKLIDCRAKIKQIDCLETLAGGLVIQVIGELSNNGKPMRRFLQTFVLAPSPDESRHDSDSQHARASGVTDRRDEKFFVLNSIFRYQDDGVETDFEDDAASLHVITDGTNGGSDLSKAELTSKQAQTSLHVGNSNGSANEFSQNRRPKPSDNIVKNVQEVERPISDFEEVERLANDLEENAKLNKPSIESGKFKQNMGVTKAVSNGTGNNLDKKNETSEKATENAKLVSDHSQQANISTTGSIATNQPATPVATAIRPQPSNEPKTWANMVRNAHPPSASVQVNVNKTPVVSEQQQQPQPQQQQQQPQQQQQQQFLHLQHQTHQHSNVIQQQQPSSVQALHQQQQHQQIQQQPQQPQQQQQQQQQIQSSPQQQGLQHNNRRRIVRKPSNKTTGGRSIKNRPPRPPAAGTGKPVA